MHLKIYQADAYGEGRDLSLADMLRVLPSEMQGRARRYRFEKDALDYVIGKLLLRRALLDINVEETLSDVRYQENGKPYLPSVFFNISHSANRIVCVLTKDGEVGVDLEKNKTIDLSGFEAYFTTREWLDIHSAENQVERFYWYWTRKESIIKALGVNLSYLHLIEIGVGADYFSDKKKRWYLQDVDFGKGFTGALCSEKKVRHQELIRTVICREEIL